MFIVYLGFSTTMRSDPTCVKGKGEGAVGVGARVVDVDVVDVVTVIPPLPSLPFPRECVCTCVQSLMTCALTNNFCVLGPRSAATSQ